MPKVIPNRPDTTERAGPEAGRGGMGDLTAPFLDALDPLGADPRQWRADPAGVAAASAALRDPHARAVLDQRLDAGVAAPLAVEPGGARRRDRMAAQSLRAQLDAIETDRVCRELAHAVWYGYAVAECLWATDAGQVALADLRVRDPARFRWRADGTPLLVTREHPRGVPLPAAKFVVLRQPRQHGGQPHGPGAGSWCVWPVWLKRQALRMWSVALEKFGAPTLIGIVRRDASDGEIERMLRTQRAIATGVGVALPEGQRLELLDSARRSGGDYGAFITALDGMMADAVLGQRATSEIGPWRGTAEVQAQVLERLVAADARRLNAALQHTVATWLTQWNHPGAAVPVLSRDLSPPEDLLARAQRDEIVARTTGLRPTQGAVEQTYGGEWEAAPGAPDPPEPPPARARTAGGESLSATFAAGDAAGPVPALVEQARGVLGPRVDTWAQRLRHAIEDAASLGEVRARLDAQRAWTAEPTAPTPEVTAVVAALTEALLAAHLAGRYDIETGPVTLARATFASAAARHTQLPFAEQVTFFRSKLDLPTSTWTDLLHEQHDRAFSVAGAAHADLVSDLRGAVDQAIAEGTTLATFRRDFDAIVAKHGWSYNGGRDWRTEVIYATNLRTSYAAGRYRQLKDGAERRPYWRYRHSDASEHPRHDHLAWDGLVLRHDDPWWDTHYPPNGWGCKCFVDALNARDLKRLGKSGPDTAPPIRTRTVTVGAQGPSPRTLTVPEGIDPGWAYAPGQSVARRTPPEDPWALPEITRADVSAARQVGGQGGSNPGGLYQFPDGALRYVKLYRGPDATAQAYGEAVANRAYRALGLDAPASVLVRDGDAIVGVGNAIIDHAGIIGAKLGRGGQNWQPDGRSQAPPKGRSREVLKGYTADVWLANWDVLGRDMDNIVKTRKGRSTVARIDQGGALLMRGLQGRKDSAALEAITEWDGFANPALNPSYAAVMRAAGVGSPDALGRQALRQIAAIEALGKRTESFKRLAPSVRGVSQADRDAIRSMLATRAAGLKRQIAPRVRAAMAAAKGQPAYQLALRRDMGTRYTRYLDAGKQKVAAGFNSHGMTDPELVSAYAYTTSDRVWGYRLLNRALREAAQPRGPKVPERYEAYRLTLNDALDRLPDYPADGLKRGTTLSPEEITKYVPDQIVTETAFTSASLGRDFGGNVRFIINARHGKRIERLSQHPSEREVLFKAGTRFRVLSKEPDGGTTYIHLEEVDDG